MDLQPMSTLDAPARSSELERLEKAIYSQRDLISALGERLLLIRRIEPSQAAVANMPDRTRHISNLVDEVERNTNAIADVINSILI